MSKIQIIFKQENKKNSKKNPSEKFFKDVKNTSNKNYTYWEK